MSEEFNDCEEICRICLSNGLNEELLSPCECRGTVSHIHYKCLIDWISVSKTDNCNICRTQYNCVEMTRTLPSVMAFLADTFKQIKRVFTAKILLTIVTIALIVWSLLLYLTYVLFREYDVFQKLCFWLLILMALLFAVWTAILVPEYRKWRIRNSVVHIRAKPKAKH